MFAIVAEELQEGRNVRLSVLGRSMRPFFKSGETVELKPITPEALFIGNIVLAKVAPNIYVIHRIFEIDGDTITIMGDGNVRGKEVVQRKNIYGYIECSARQLYWARVWRRLLPVRRYLLAVDKLLCSLVSAEN